MGTLLHYCKKEIINLKKIINLLGSKMGKIGYALVKRKNIFDFLLRALKKSPDVHIVPASKTSLIFWPILG